MITCEVCGAEFYDDEFNEEIFNFPMNYDYICKDCMYDLEIIRCDFCGMLEYKENLQMTKINGIPYYYHNEEKYKIDKK